MEETSDMYKRVKRIISGVFLIIVCICLNGCILQGTGGLSSRPSHPIGEQGHDLTWAADAFPGYACPNDDIVLKWNVGDPKCPERMGPECQTLRVVSNVGFPEFTSTSLSGEHSVGSVSNIEGWAGTNPSFTFSVTHHDRDADILFGWDNRTSYVEIIPNPTSSIIKEFSPGSACNNISCMWRLDEYRLDMEEQSFINSTKGLGNCIRIASICYKSSSIDQGEQRPGGIDISVIESGEVRHLGSLEYRECIENLNLRPNLEYIVNPDSRIPLMPRETGTCCDSPAPGGSVLTPHPFIDLEFTLTCDSVSDECT